MRTQGETLKLAIKGSGLTQDEAASKLGMTRQNLSTYFHRYELPDEFIDSVRTKLGIDVLQMQSNVSVVNEASVLYETALAGYKRKGHDPSQTLLSDFERDSLILLLSSDVKAALKVLARNTATIEKKDEAVIDDVIDQYQHEGVRAIDIYLKVIKQTRRKGA